ncbi:MAG: methylenetetrahydrofolate reductase [Thermoanaerobacterales bacterium]|nr:methylenetetrahydrofolate reductase [Thermoanaerobacterales bacterium]
MTVSRLARTLSEARFAVTAEVGPPKHAAARDMREKARLLRGWVDAVNVTDCQSAVVRLSSLAGCLHVQDEGVEAVLQVTCRDKNRIAIQSDLLGAASLGIRNVLCLTGDHQRFGNHPQAKGVFDLDSVQLLGVAKGLTEGRFANGETMKGPAPELLLGAVENPTAGPPELRALRLAKKVEAGVRFVQTQGVFDLERFKQFMALVNARGLTQRAALLAGVIVLKSGRAARFMRENVPGIYIPEGLVERMERAPDPREEGVAIAVETVRTLREIPGVAGVHLMAIGWEEIMPRIVSEAGLR